MDRELRETLTALLTLLVTLVQMAMKIGPQNARLTALEERVEKIEKQLQGDDLPDQEVHTRDNAMML